MASAQTQGADPAAVRSNKLTLVERLADDLAHEIKNPLHSMVINLEVLRRRIGRLPEEHQGDLLRYAGVLGGELDRVSRRIDLLLRLIRPQRGAELTTLGQSVQELLDLLELERERHGVSIDFQAAADPVRPHLRREEAWQLTLNLLLEALEGAPAGGVVTIRTRTHGGRAVLQIRSTPVPGHAGENGAAAESPRVAVARSLARTLHGELEVAGESGLPGVGHGHGVGFTLSIPTAPP